MTRKRFIENVNIDTVELDYTRWPTVHFDKRNEIFEKRKKAVEMYLDGQTTLKHISEVTGIKRKELNTFIRKCLEQDDEGRIWGFRALIPNKRTGEKYVRISETSGFALNRKLTGAFKLLLEQYPILDQTIREYILNRRKRPVADKVIRVKDLRDDKFLKLCRALGISMNEYPFNTVDKALRSLYRYVDQIINENIEEASSRFGDEAKRKLNGFDGEPSQKELIVVPYECVYFDGHKIDALLTVRFINAYGDEVDEVMRRIWLLLIMDDATRAVLGHCLCLNAEYSQSDVLHCIRKSIVPWKPMTLTIPGLKYPDKPGYPSGAIPEAEWALWSELKYDNALANLAGVVKDRLTKIVNCSVNPGKVKFPEARSIIERFFGILESNYIHRIGNTTGSNPKDPKRKKPEKTAKKYQIRAEELEQVIEVAIAEYNNQTHSILGISPLEAMEQRIKFRDMIPRVLDEDKRKDISFFCLQTNRVIRGTKNSGKRPHINYEGVEYTSPLLAKNFSLVGEAVIVEVNIDDISVVKVYLSDGQELDYLRARGAWGKTPHSLRTRQIINKLAREGKLRLDEHKSPVEALESYLEEKATTNKSARNQLAALQRYNQSAVLNEDLDFIEDKEYVFDTTFSVSEETTIANYDDMEKIRSMLKTNC